jgi:hypothetical protein
MKGLKTLTAVVAGAALLATAVPATAGTAAFKHYVACGSSKLSQNSKASHSCEKSDRKGAFFQSNAGDVSYTVCVKFPTGKNLCASQQAATQGTLYVNRITSNIPGKHRVSWFVSGKRVGLFVFNIPG